MIFLGKESYSVKTSSLNMQVPLKSIIKAKRDWLVLYLKQPNIPSSHYYVCIPITEHECVVACIITSKIEKNVRFYEQKKAHNSLVHVNEKILPCLDRKSIVNCNNATIIDIQDIDNGIITLSKYKETAQIIVPYELKKKIYKAIISSKIVSDDIKDILPTL